MKTLAMIAAVVVATGCASQASQKEGPTGAGYQEPIRRPDDSQKNAAGCDGKTSSLSLYQQGAGKIDGKSLAVFQDRSKKEKSLCDVLSGTQKKVAIFQFAGVDCLSCQDEAKATQAEIAAHPRGKDIVHVVVMTDFFADYDDADYRAFGDKYAPNAVMVYDEAKLWKYFSEDSSSPNRATIVAMNLSMNAVVYNKEGSQDKIFSAAVGLLP